MPQVLRPETIGAITKLSNTQLSIAPSNPIIGGQQRPTTAITITTSTNGINGMDTGAVAANQFYYIYIVRSSVTGLLGGVISLSATTPTGFASYKLVGQCTTDGSSNLVTANQAVNDNSPVGHVMSAMLTEAQFRAIHGAGWVLADGRSVTGSKYATITSNTAVPDLRGIVLRGKNNGRSDGNQDPGGERALGSFQGQATARNGLTLSDSGHAHTTSTRIYTDNTGVNHPQLNLSAFLSNASNYGANSSSSTNSAVQSASSNVSLGQGDTETRMRNAAVNHFIKIN